MPYEPKPLKGDAMSRLRVSRRVVRAKRRLIRGTLAVLGVAVLLWVLQSGEKPEVRQEEVAQRSAEPARGMDAAAEVPVAPRANVGGAVVSGPLAGVLEQERSALDVLGSFLAAKNAEERLAYCFDSNRIHVAMEQYYKDEPDGPIAFTGVTEIETVGGDILEFAVRLKDGSERRAFVLRRSGEYRVDWASFVGQGDMKFAELGVMRPTSPTLMRVWVRPGTHFGGAFADSKRLHCVELRPTEAIEGPVIHAYVEKSSMAGSAVEYCLRDRSRPAYPWTVLVRYPFNVDTGDQVWLERLVSETWLVVGDP
jgi:hypothetical protein